MATQHDDKTVIDDVTMLQRLIDQEKGSGSYNKFKEKDKLMVASIKKFVLTRRIQKVIKSNEEKIEQLNRVILTIKSYGGMPKKPNYSKTANPNVSFERKVA